jgi:hypothetical protein
MSNLAAIFAALKSALKVEIQAHSVSVAWAESATR